MEKVEQAICIYMICLSVKISISYFAWKALDRNATTCLSQIRGTVGIALIEEWTIKPMRFYFTLLRCSGQDAPTITFMALELHQGLPSSMTPFPLLTALQGSSLGCSYSQQTKCLCIHSTFSTPLQWRMYTLMWIWKEADIWWGKTNSTSIFAEWGHYTYSSSGTSVYF